MGGRGGEYLSIKNVLLLCRRLYLKYGTIGMKGAVSWEKAPVLYVLLILLKRLLQHSLYHNRKNK